MGGYGSGRQGGRPTTDTSFRIDIAWLVRTRRVIPGSHTSGMLTWSWSDEPAGWIRYSADMTEPDTSKLILTYSRGGEQIRQTVRLAFTEPNYGGRRWWMICPSRGDRVGKLYLPGGGDSFAGRKSWRLGYKSQRKPELDLAFDSLFRLQKKLGCPQGWNENLVRPKGMWQRTFDRYLSRYLALDAKCSLAMADMMRMVP
jgi:hypothetical protein